MKVIKTKTTRKKQAVNKKARIAMLVLLVILLAAAMVTAIVFRHEDGGIILSGLGRITKAKIVTEDQIYSYYDSNGGSLLRADTDHGAGSGTMCEVIVPYAEATRAVDESNRSNPKISPLVRGTIDRVVSVVGTEDNPIYCLASGVKINDEYLRITENGFCMPENRISVNSCKNSVSGIQIKFDTLWAVPVLVSLEPQTYYTGYQERPYNVESFTAEYMDIFFSETTEMTGELDFSESDVIKNYEWIEGENGGTLRLHFRKTGEFFGYSYSLDKNGRYVFVINRSSYNNASPTVMLDAGHGGGDPGAASVAGEYESIITLDIAKRTAKILSENGVNVLMTRSEEIHVSLDDRIAMARKYNPSLFVSIHCDSSDGGDLYGTHTFYYKNYSERLAHNIQEKTAANYAALYADNPAKAENSDKGIKYYPFAVTRIEECPSVLVECGYISNPEDCAFLMSDEGRQKTAQAIADGILQTLTGRKSG